MKPEAREIEVEVVEVDGVVPAAADEPAPESRVQPEWPDWRSLQGRVRTLDARWWPLWGLLGMVALFLLLTLGLVIAVVYLMVRLISRMLRALFR
jgi:hypothetical protein